MRGNENEVSQMQLNYLQTEIIYENHTENKYHAENDTKHAIMLAVASQFQKWNRVRRSLRFLKFVIILYKTILFLFVFGF